MKGGSEQEVRQLKILFLKWNMLKNKLKLLNRKCDLAEDKIKNYKKAKKNRQVILEKKKLKKLKVEEEKIRLKMVALTKQITSLQDNMTKNEIDRAMAEVYKGGKYKKTKKTRKHKGIVQSGGNKGRLKKGYRYTGKYSKNGLAEIIITFSQTCI